MTTFYKQNRPSARIHIAKAAIVLIASSATGWTQAQNAPPAAEATLPDVNVSTPRAHERAQISGFGDIALREAPFSTTVIDSAIVQTLGARSLRDLQGLDASMSDAYNAIGYIDYASMRGYVIDNSSNMRRDGMPINGNTAIGLANKDRVEILRGTSGLQAGVSSPGGLLNYIVKRPAAKPIRDITLHTNSHGAFGAAVDISSRFGTGNAQGLRINAAVDRLSDAAPNTQGRSHQIALALDTRIGSAGLLEAEIEHNRQSQPSVPGLSLLGAAGLVPDANPKLQINQQAWTLPVVFSASTASLRYSQEWSAWGTWGVELAQQRLLTQDRAAFPLGCSAQGLSDRYCADGSFDLYDYRSDHEKRTNRAIKLFASDRAMLLGQTHHWRIEWLSTQATERLPEQQTYQLTTATGTPTSIYTHQPHTANATPNFTNTNKTERSNELSLSNRVEISTTHQLWLGLRHSRLDRASAQNAPAPGTNAVRLQKSINTPWLAWSWRLSPTQTLYASHGHGVEVASAPNSPLYANAGQQLGISRSRQTEIGWRYTHGTQASALQALSITLFDIDRPFAYDIYDPITYTNTRHLEGRQQAQGLEASISLQSGAASLGASLALLDHNLSGVRTQASLNSKRPVNVPNHILRLHATYTLAPGWQTGAQLSRQGSRAALPDNSVRIPSWTRLDAHLRYSTRQHGAQTTFLLGIDNLLNTRYIKESPYQFGHSYLMPASPRTLRASISASL